MPSRSRRRRPVDLLRAAAILPLLVAVDLVLRRRGLRGAQDLFGPAGPQPKSGAAAVVDPAADPRVARFVGSIDRAGRLYRTGGRCLRRSVLLWAWLQRHGVPAEIVVGVRREPGGLTGHAWVESSQGPVFESAEVREANVSFGSVDRRVEL